VLPLTPPETRKLAAWEPSVHFGHRIARIWTRLLAIWGVIQLMVSHHQSFSSVDKIKRAIVKSMAETTTWRSHCQFITFITFYLRLMLFTRWRHYFPRLIQINYGMMFSMKRTWFSAKFGKDLFNISKVIGRKKVAQFFWLTVYSSDTVATECLCGLLYSVTADNLLSDLSRLLETRVGQMSWKNNISQHIFICCDLSWYSAVWIEELLNVILFHMMKWLVSGITHDDT